MCREPKRASRGGGEAESRVRRVLTWRLALRTPAAERAVSHVEPAAPGAGTMVARVQVDDSVKLHTHKLLAGAPTAIPGVANRVITERARAASPMVVVVVVDPISSYLLYTHTHTHTRTFVVVVRRAWGKKYKAGGCFRTAEKKQKRNSAKQWRERRKARFFL